MIVICFMRGQGIGMEWYHMIARRNGGYKNNATYTVEGFSAGIIFLVLILLGIITKKMISFNTIRKCLIFIVIGGAVYEIYRILHEE